jgi:HEAT repeat protein
MKHLASSSTLLRRLQGGDRRSLGRSAVVVRDAMEDPALVGDLIGALDDPDPIVRMRAADALEKATRAHPVRLTPFKTTLLRQARSSGQHEVRWHLAQLLPRLPLTRRERASAVTTLHEYLQDRSSIVRTCALQALADLAAVDPALRPAVRATIEAAMVDGTPAMRARGRKLLARWPPDAGATGAARSAGTRETPCV